ncbi:uracil-DNA glycosylase [Pseudobdellovibrio exovorus]|uniref:Uracil-DNA glycosylase n=1 Tax=Pseudobdellovibrio exovorus JSS TaxID=1184267 RepID=M4V8A8_9BACT|nr:uracil-DNA glycosylase [Pseudobdellovibrio exovorus]AGH94685.1 uracil-DNA glycosylase [Pseudobdellovibrio exovorus JSS]
MSQIKLSNSWLEYLKGEFEKEHMKKLKLFLTQQYQNKKIIFPATQNYFRALDLVDVKKVRVVILGQDPYHGVGQAHGLSFSVPEGVPFPPSLQNIFKELKEDLKIDLPKSGDLTRWAEQGVLLLNSVLTVEKDKAASHQNQGWELFTDKIISVINEECDHVVFVLWGAYAQKKAAFVDKKKHLVLASPHPSPLSAHRGFFGTRPFSKANAWLKSKGKEPIQW